MDCRIALRGAMSGRISIKTEKSSKHSDLFDHSNLRHSVCTSGFFVRHACHRDGSLQPAPSIFWNA
jgi:hypothetical protein